MPRVFRTSSAVIAFAVCLLPTLSYSTSLPIYAERGRNTLIVFLDSRAAHGGSNDVVVKGQLRIIRKHAEAEATETVYHSYEARCTRGQESVGDLRIDPRRAPKQRGLEPLSYAIWREACRGHIAPEFSPHTLACIEEVPKTIRQLAEYGERNRSESGKALENVNSLLQRYCFVAEEPLSADREEAIGDGCVMRSGILRGTRVYWSTCSGAEKRMTSRKGNKSAGGDSRRCFVFNGERFCQ